jgi:hypothetical protein
MLDVNGIRTAAHVSRILDVVGAQMIQLELVLVRRLVMVQQSTASGTIEPSLTSPVFVPIPNPMRVCPRPPL